MIIFKCDRCKKSYEAFSVNGVKSRTNSIWTGNYSFDGHAIIEHRADLCPDCCAKLDDFLKGRGEVDPFNYALDKQDEAVARIKEELKRKGEPIFTR